MWQTKQHCISSWHRTCSFSKLSSWHRIRPHHSTANKTHDTNCCPDNGIISVRLSQQRHSKTEFSIVTLNTKAALHCQHSSSRPEPIILPVITHLIQCWRWCWSADTIRSDTLLLRDSPWMQKGSVSAGWCQEGYRLVKIHAKTTARKVCVCVLFLFSKF